MEPEKPALFVCIFVWQRREIMRKTGLILLAFLLVFTSIPFTTPFTPAVEAAGDDGKRETFNITLPNAYGQKPTGYKFQKINHSGKMNYSIVVEIGRAHV